MAARKDAEKTRTKHYFSRVDAVRDKLAEKMDKYVELHEIAATNAAKRGDASPVQWLLSHVSVKDTEGKEQRPISSSVDAKESQGAAAPGSGVQILIGGFPLAAAPPIAIIEGAKVAIPSSPSRPLLKD